MKTLTVSLTLLALALGATALVYPPDLSVRDENVCNSGSLCEQACLDNSAGWSLAGAHIVDGSCVCNWVGAGFAPDEGGTWKITQSKLTCKREPQKDSK